MKSSRLTWLDDSTGISQNKNTIGIGSDYDNQTLYKPTMA